MHALVYPQVGTPTAGHYCTQCHLPAILIFPLLWLRNDGVREIGTYTRCMECDPLPEDD